jgi:hypothetical protein
MTTHDQPRSDWATVLRCQPGRVVTGRPECGCTGAYEIVCRVCGDDPALDYRDVSPRLQLVRGPYQLMAGVAAYLKHMGLHERQQAMGKAADPGQAA